MNLVVKWALGFAFCVVHISAKHFLIKIKAEDGKNSASDYSSDEQSHTEKLAAYGEKVDALSENGAGRYSSMKFDWDNAKKRDKLCKIFEESDEYYDSRCDTKRSSYSIPDNKEDLELCQSYDSIREFGKTICFGPEEPEGKEEREYCEDIIKYVKDRKLYCNVNEIEKYYS